MIERRILTALALCLAVIWLLSGGGSDATLLGAMPAKDDLVSPPLLSVLLVLLLVGLNALFVASETAVDVLRSVHAKFFKDSAPEKSRRVQKLMASRQHYVAGASVGGQLCRMALVFLCFAIGHALSIEANVRLGWPLDFRSEIICALIAAIPVGMLNLILGELVPKSYASLNPHKVAVRLYRFIRVSSLVLWPASALSVSVASMITSRFGGQASFTIANQAEEEIKTLVETAQEAGEIEVDEKELLHSVFEFSDTVAREVMTPRVDLDAVSIDSDPAEIISLIEESGHSRIPIFERTDDQIVGILHAKELLLASVSGRKVAIRELMRPVIFVPENKNLHELLREMRAQRSQLAVVQDEFGGTAGIVTIEDIVEELVGDIIDEYDVEEAPFQQTEQGYLVDGRTHLDDVNAEMGTEFESEEFDTVGGYVFGLFGRQPKQGESIDAEGYRFEVADTDGRRINRLMITKVAEEPTLDETSDDV